MTANVRADPWVVWMERTPLSYGFKKLSEFRQMENETNAEDRTFTDCMPVPAVADSLFEFLREEENERSQLFLAHAPGAMEFDFFPVITDKIGQIFFHRGLFRTRAIDIASQATEDCIWKYERALNGPVLFNFNRSRIFAYQLEEDYHNVGHDLIHRDTLLFAYGLMTRYIHDGHPVGLKQNTRDGAVSLPEHYGREVARKWPLFYQEHIQPMFHEDDIDGRKPKVPYVIGSDD